MLRRYVHGSDAGADDPLLWFEGTSTSFANARHLYADPRGSIVLVGNSTGASIAINSYDEYGIPAAGNVGRFQYTGQAWLPELGMYYYKARIYSPTLGRFLQTDPIGYEDQYNLYAYVGNDPVNGVDPTGLATDLQNAQLSECVYDSKCTGVGDFKRTDFASDSETGFSAGTFSNGKETVVAFAGTNSVKDAMVDLGNEAGVATAQYGQAVDYAKSAVAAAGKGSIAFTGHSLGGGLATVASAATGKSAAVFNAASPSKGAFAAAGTNRAAAESRVRNVYVRGDPVTRWQAVRLSSNPGSYDAIGSVARYGIPDGISWITNHPIGTVIDLLKD